jgi:hypothetical protein
VERYGIPDDAAALVVLPSKDGTHAVTTCVFPVGTSPIGESSMVTRTVLAAIDGVYPAKSRYFYIVIRDGRGSVSKPYLTAESRDEGAVQAVKDFPDACVVWVNAREVSLTGGAVGVFGDG